MKRLETQLANHLAQIKQYDKELQRNEREKRQQLQGELAGIIGKIGKNKKRAAELTTHIQSDILDSTRALTIKLKEMGIERYSLEEISVAFNNAVDKEMTVSAEYSSNPEECKKRLIASISEKLFKEHDWLTKSQRDEIIGFIATLPVVTNINNLIEMREIAEENKKLRAQAEIILAKLDAIIKSEIEPSAPPYDSLLDDLNFSASGLYSSTLTSPPPEYSIMDPKLVGDDSKSALPLPPQSATDIPHSSPPVPPLDQKTMGIPSGSEMSSSPSQEEAEKKLKTERSSVPPLKPSPESVTPLPTDTTEKKSPDPKPQDVGKTKEQIEKLKQEIIKATSEAAKILGGEAQGIVSEESFKAFINVDYVAEMYDSGYSEALDKECREIVFTDFESENKDKPEFGKLGDIKKAFLASFDPIAKLFKEMKELQQQLEEKKKESHPEPSAPSVAEMDLEHPEETPTPTDTPQTSMPPKPTSVPPKPPESQKPEPQKPEPQKSAPKKLEISVAIPTIGCAIKALGCQDIDGVKNKLFETAKQVRQSIYGVGAKLAEPSSELTAEQRSKKQLNYNDLLDRLEGQLPLFEDVDLTNPQQLENTVNNGLATVLGVETKTLGGNIKDPDEITKEIQAKLKAAGVAEDSVAAVTQQLHELIKMRLLLNMTEKAKLEEFSNEARFNQYIEDLKRREKEFNDIAAKGPQINDTDQKLTKEDLVRKIEELKKENKILEIQPGLYAQMDADGKPFYRITDFNSQNISKVIDQLKHSKKITWNNTPKRYREGIEVACLQQWKAVCFKKPKITPLSQAMPERPGDWAQWFRNIDKIRPRWIDKFPFNLRASHKKTLIQQVVGMNPERLREFWKSIVKNSEHDLKLFADVRKYMTEEQKNALQKMFKEEQEKLQQAQSQLSQEQSESIDDKKLKKAEEDRKSAQHELEKILGIVPSGVTSTVTPSVTPPGTPLDTPPKTTPGEPALSALDPKLTAPSPDIYAEYKALYAAVLEDEKEIKRCWDGLASGQREKLEKIGEKIEEIRKEIKNWPTQHPGQDAMAAKDEKGRLLVDKLKEAVEEKNALMASIGLSPTTPTIQQLTQQIQEKKARMAAILETGVKQEKAAKTTGGPWHKLTTAVMRLLGADRNVEESKIDKDKHATELGQCKQKLAEVTKEAKELDKLFKKPKSGVEDGPGLAITAASEESEEQKQKKEQARGDFGIRPQ